MVGRSMKDAIDQNALQNVIDAVGINLISFLHPKQLFRLSIVSRHYYHDLIRPYILSICQLHLQSTMKLGTGSNYLIEFKRGRSFHNKTELWDHILTKVTPNLMSFYNDRSSFDDALSQLQTMPQSQSNDVKLVGAHGITILTASCNTQQRNNIIAHGLACYIMNRHACKNNSKGKQYYNFVWDWLNYCIHLRDITFHYWEWDLLYNCKREFGKGLVFSLGVEEVEIRLSRFY
jgi:hypothetical protein